MVTTRAICFLVLFTAQIGAFPSRELRTSDASDGSEGGSDDTDSAPTNFQFAYEVIDGKTTNYQRRFEKSENGLLQGSYSHLAPDGVVRTVMYSDDGSSGYQAVLRETPSNIAVIGSGSEKDSLEEGRDSQSSGSAIKYGETKITNYGNPTVVGLPDFPDRLEGLGNFFTSVRSKDSGKSGQQEDLSIYVAPSVSDKSPTESYTRSKSLVSLLSDSESSDSDESSSENFSGSESEFLSASDDSESRFSVSGDFASASSIEEDTEARETAVTNDKKDKSSSTLQTLSEAVHDNPSQTESFTNTDTVRDNSVFISSDVKTEDHSSSFSADGGDKSQRGIPVIVLNQTFFESLEPANSKRLVMAIQNAMQLAISSAATKKDSKTVDTGVSGLSKAIKDSDVVSETPDAVKDEGASSSITSGGIPVIVLEQTLFESFDKPGGSLTKEKLISAIQESLKRATEQPISDLRTVTNDAEDAADKEDYREFFNRLQSSESRNVKSSNELAKVGHYAIEVEDNSSEGGNTLNAETVGIPVANALYVQSGVLPKDHLGSQLAQEEEGFGRKIPATTVDSANSGHSNEGGISVIALRKELFDSLDSPRRTLTKSHLVKSVQRALQAATGSSLSDPLKESGVDTDQSDSTAESLSGDEKVLKNKIAGKTKPEHSSHIDTLAIGMPVVALNKAVLDSSHAPEGTQKIKEQQLANSLEQAVETSAPSALLNTLKVSDLETGDSFRISGYAETEDEPKSLEDVFESETHDHSALENSRHSNGLKGGIPVIAFKKDVFDSLDVPGSTVTKEELAKTIQLALKLATLSPNIATKNVADEKSKDGGHAEANASEQRTLTVATEKDHVTKDEKLNSERILGEDNLIGNIPQGLQVATSSDITEPDNSFHSVLGEDKSLVGKLASTDNTLLKLDIVQSTNLEDNVDKKGGSHGNILGGGIPVIVLEKGRFESLDSSRSALTKEQFVKGIQQALQDATGTATATKTRGGLSSSVGDLDALSRISAESTVDSDDQTLLQNSEDNVILNNKVNDKIERQDGSSNSGTSAKGIPVIAINKGVFESLDNSKSKITKEQLAKGIQQALQVATGSTDSTVAQTVTEVDGRTNDSPSESKFSKNTLGITLDESASDSQSNPFSTMSKEHFTINIQQSSEDGTGKSNAESAVPDTRNIRISSSSDSREDVSLLDSSEDRTAVSDFNEDIIRKAGNQPVTMQGGIPVTILLKDVFDSLDAPGSTLTKEQLVQGIQKAMQAASDTTSTTADHSVDGGANRVSQLETDFSINTPTIKSSRNFFISSKDEGSEKQEEEVFDSKEGDMAAIRNEDHSGTSDDGIPVIVLDEAFFDSLHAQGGPLTNEQLVLNIQQALQTAMAGTDSDIKDGVKSSANSKFSKGTGQDANDASGVAGSLVPTDGLSAKGGIPVIAVDKAFFDSLDNPGRRMSKEHLVLAIQQAMKTAKDENTSFIAEDKSDSSNTKNKGDGGIPVIALRETQFQTLDSPGRILNKEKLVEGIQRALQSAVRDTNVNTHRNKIIRKRDHSAHGHLQSGTSTSVMDREPNDQSRNPILRNGIKNAFSTFTNSITEFRQMHNRKIGPLLEVFHN